MGNRNPVNLAAPYANTTIVEKGQSLQSVVTAAASRYVATGEVQYVIRMPGVKLDHTRALGVVVVDAAQYPTRKAGLLRSVEATMDLIPLSYPGMLISARADDGYPGWLTTDAAFDGLCPLAYSALKQVIWNHGIIPLYNANADNSRMTAVQQQTAVQKYAGTRNWHSYSHGNGPTTQKELDKETIYARDYLEKLAVTGTPTGYIGDSIEGGFQPGSWGTGADSANVASRMDNWADYDAWIGRHIRATFPWSATDGYNINMGTPYPKHFSKYFSIASEAAFDNIETAKAWIYSRAYPGARLEVLVHNPLADATTKTRIRNFIDAIAAVRDDRTTYPDRTVHSVTASALRYGVQPPAYYSAGVIQEPAGTILHDDFTGLSASALTLPWQSGQFRIAKAGTNTGTATVVDDAGNKTIELVSSGTGNMIMIFYIYAAPGRYLFRMRCKSTAAATLLGLGYTYYDTTDDNGVTETALQLLGDNILNPVTPEDYGYIGLPIFVPDYSNGKNYLQLSLVPGYDLTIDNIDVSVMG